jgi:hypothetical protein
MLVNQVNQPLVHLVHLGEFRAAALSERDGMGPGKSMKLRRATVHHQGSVAC